MMYHGIGWKLSLDGWKRVNSYPDAGLWGWQFCTLEMEGEGSQFVSWLSPSRDAKLLSTNYLKAQNNITVREWMIRYIFVILNDWKNVLLCALSWLLLVTMGYTIFSSRVSMGWLLAAKPEEIVIFIPPIMLYVSWVGDFSNIMPSLMTWSSALGVHQWFRRPKEWPC